jgi:capsular polysaccharide transport system permease protein
MSAHTLRPHRVRREGYAVQHAVLYALLLRELKTRFGGRWLGVYWALLEPLAQVVLLSLLFGTLHDIILPGIDYPVFLLTGIVPFYLFRSLAMRLMEGIDSNRSLFAYRQVKPIDTLVARALLEIGVHGVISLLMFGIFSTLGMQWWPSHPLEILVLGMGVVAGGVGLGLTLAVATANFPQLRSFARIVFLPLYLLSGVMAPVHVLPSEYWPLLLLNPLLHVVELSRAMFLPSYRLLEGVSASYVAWCALVALATGLALYHARRQQLMAQA